MENENRRPHFKDGPIKYTKGYKTRLFFNWLFKASFFLVLLTLVCSVIFIYMKNPVNTENGIVYADPLYKIAQHGEDVIIIEGEGTNLITPIMRVIFKQEAYRAKVVAGPYGVIEIVNGKQRVSDGQNIIPVYLELEDDFLDMEYVVRKIDEEGNPIEGKADSIIIKEEILGTTKK